MLDIETKKKIYFIGIGGIGMSGIAEVLHEMGFIVSGSDINKNHNTMRLEKIGIEIKIGHKKSNIKSIDLIIISSAIKKNNEELKESKTKGIPILTRAKMLAELMRLKYAITVAGSHGKTTTTSLVASIMEQAKLDPTVINGGIINKYNTNAKLGKGKWIVAEADESDGSFTFLPSTICLINNIDPEHLDFYKSFNNLKEAFIQYGKKIPFYGFISLCIDEKSVKELIPHFMEQKIITYGLSKNANITARNISFIHKRDVFYTKFDAIINLEKKIIIKNIRAPILGEHNLKNILGAISITINLKIEGKIIKKALEKFRGVKRRFTLIYNKQNIKVFDDYAHHPKEILVTLNTLKKVTKGKVITIFQPHRFSRTRELFDEFIKSFHFTDKLFISPVYSAGEKEIKNFNHHSLVKNINKYKITDSFSCALDESLFIKIFKLLKPKDNVIFLGAGSITNYAHEFSKYLKKNARYN
ncbi:MAG: UDP-N-acetylmuramate--L-alanine ligase [Rickettsiales bacterium]|nr:UDP-N-acetylmuramate--L-alanine ligase [Rickettsiales bacterium]OUV53161.1 MAG: UDP-N-acetylmuramate--L-alanine ligase [Rickettsiales bacterium TMED127]|tara:strand:+ start:12526 stop:13941 length:1416 start_codon:yes stop_codon:yes gene_type:complete